MSKLGPTIAKVMARQPKLEYSDVLDLIKAGAEYERNKICQWLSSYNEHLDPQFVSDVIRGGHYDE